MIIKTLLSTLLRKKARAAMLLFSVAACSALLFANSGFQRTVGQMIYDADTRWSGRSDIIITARQSVGAEEWINAGFLASYENQLEYAYQFINASALYIRSDEEMHYFTALGVDREEFNNHNPLELEAGGTGGWNGYKIILGTTYAQMLGVSVGDSLPLEIAGAVYSFEIAGISREKGLFMRELADGGYMLMPKETLAAVTGGQCNLIFLKAIDTSSVPELTRELENALPQYYVRLGINPDVIQAETMNYAMPFWASSVIVIGMSAFIIYSSFNLIVNERIKMLGILRSVGCGRKKINRILIFESISIGVIGGAAGCLMGIGILHIIVNTYFSGEASAVEVPVLYGAGEVLFTITASAVITMMSAVLPIINITGEPVKNIILNDFPRKKVRGEKLWPLGILFFCPCVTVPFFIGKGFAGMVTASAAAMLVLMGLYLVIPALCRVCAFAARRLPYEIELGVRNAGDLKALVNNIRLFAATLAVMAFMTTIFNTLGSDLINISLKNKYDISVTLRRSDAQTLETLSRTDGVADYYGVYTAPATITNHGTFLNQLAGIDGEEYFEYLPADISPDARAALNALNEGNNIVTTYILRDKLSLKLGDMLTLQTEYGVHDYTITGFLDTNRGIGHVGYISSERYKADLGVSDYSRLYVRASGDPDIVKRNIRRALSRDLLSVQTKREQDIAEADKVIGIFTAVTIAV